MSYLCCYYNVINIIKSLAILPVYFYPPDISDPSLHESGFQGDTSKKSQR